jgi:hypothetical protein
MSGAEACPYGALRGICATWAHCPVCGPEMWLRIWSRVPSTSEGEGA